MALAVPLSRFTSRVGGGSAFFVRHHYTLMKNTITITSSVAGLLAFLFFVDITYWHVGLSMLQFRHHMEFVVALFFVGLALSFLATLLAASSLPKHWRSGSAVGWFICSFAAVAGFFWLLATGL